MVCSLTTDLQTACCSNGHTAVSYTHLDVYKRQDLLFEKRLHCDYENLENKELSGKFDEAEKMCIRDRYPLAVKLHLADLESTYLREQGTSAVRKK